MGRKSDGSIMVTGVNSFGQCEIPESNGNFTAISAGTYFCTAILGPDLTNAEESRPGLSLINRPMNITSIVPNPFNPSTDIAFETSLTDNLSMEVFDMAGNRIRTLHLGSRAPGMHHVRWDGCDTRGKSMSSGVYFMRLCGSTGVSQVVKAVLVR